MEHQKVRWTQQVLPLLGSGDCKALSPNDPEFYVQTYGASYEDARAHVHERMLRQLRPKYLKMRAK